MSITNIAQHSPASQVTRREVWSTTREKPVIDLSDSIADITENIIDDLEYSHLPSDIFEKSVLKAINDLVDDFAIDPHKYLQPKHFKQIDAIAREYLNS